MKHKIRELLKNEEIRKIIKFGLVGVCNTAVDFIVYWFTAVFLGLNMYFGQTCAYLIATLNSYLLNRTWTFHSKKSFFSLEILQFFTVNLVSMGTSLGLLHLFCDVHGMDKMLAKIPIAFFTFTINYLGNRLWVFCTKKEGRK